MNSPAFSSVLSIPISVLLFLLCLHFLYDLYLVIFFPLSFLLTPFFLLDSFSGHSHERVNELGLPSFLGLWGFQCHLAGADLGLVQSEGWGCGPSCPSPWVS